MENPGAMEYQGIVDKIGIVNMHKHPHKIGFVRDRQHNPRIIPALSAWHPIYFWASSPATPWTFNILFFVIYIGYYTYLEGTRGQTVGKMVTKIKVVREDGGEIDISTSLYQEIF